MSPTNGTSHGKPTLSHLVLGAIAVSFAAMAVFRLDSLHLLEPDSSDYVIMAHSLAQKGEYRRSPMTQVV